MGEIVRPMCPCGHPSNGHFLAGCLDNQWCDESSDVYCPCERDEDQAEAAAAAEPR